MNRMYTRVPESCLHVLGRVNFRSQKNPDEHRLNPNEEPH
jgi:hypothetical protein